MKQKRFLAGLLALALFGLPLYADAAQGAHEPGYMEYSYSDPTLTGEEMPYYQRVTMMSGTSWILTAEVTRIEGLTDAIRTERLADGSCQITALADTGDLMLHFYYKNPDGSGGESDAKYLIHIVPFDWDNPKAASFETNPAWEAFYGRHYGRERPADEASFPERIIAIVNEERAKAGARPLRLDPELTEAAMLRAREIKTSFSHTRPDGRPFATAVSGYRHRALGENIHAGTATPEDAMRSWMNSPGHRKNILMPRYSKLGVGYYFDEGGEYAHYWVQIFED